MLLFEEQPEKTNGKIISNAKKQTIRIFLFFIVVISFLNAYKYILLYFLTKINMRFSQLKTAEIRRLMVFNIIPTRLLTGACLLCRNIRG